MELKTVGIVGYGAFGGLVESLVKHVASVWGGRKEVRSLLEK